MIDDRDIKRQKRVIHKQVQERAYNLARKERIRKREQRRCFWTWPLGHIWTPAADVGEYCAVCKKRK